MKRFALYWMAWLVVATAAYAQTDWTELGQLTGGAKVVFARADKGEWGINITGGSTPALSQSKPAQIEVWRGETNASVLASGYQTVQKEGDAVVAKATVTDGAGATFALEDRWTLSGAVLSLIRKVSVASTVTDAGFFSAIRLATAPSVKWDDLTCLVPGLLYGDASHAGGGVPTSVANYRAKRLSIREDYLSAPLLGVMFKDGNWAAVLDQAPRGDTTQAETTGSAATPIIDERIQFGAVGTQELAEGGVELAFWLPGTTTEISRAMGRRGDTPSSAQAPATTVRRRYHPVKAGLTQSYQVGFRFDKSASFPAMEREAWRWAWATLAPKVNPVNVEVARKALVDHLADRVLTSENRFGIPYQGDTMSGRSSSTKILMSFCGKNIEAADQFLVEADRDKTERGERLRGLGLGIIESFVRIVPMSPAPGGSGFDIQSGQPITGNMGTMTLRGETEDLPFLMAAYQREKQAGRDHPDWLKWVVCAADWVVAQQREDGSFPMSFQTGTTTPREASGACTYAPVPTLVKLSQLTGDKKYLNAALKASEYLWTTYGSNGVYLGATGTASVADKESGMLSLEAFLAAYESTQDAKWLQRAESAASYTESWIWIWNVPMPVDANDATLHWKQGVPTVGVNGIGSDVAGHVDQFLDWAVPCYAELYKLTKDTHYLDVARILLHNTKAMVALPGRTYDMVGPGWQQEHWRMGPGTRGMGAHRSWLPWISVNHLHGIIGLDQYDPALYQQLSKVN